MAMPSLASLNVSRLESIDGVVGMLERFKVGRFQGYPRLGSPRSDAYRGGPADRT